jgi:hypothetical protein
LFFLRCRPPLGCRSADLVNFLSLLLGLCSPMTGLEAIVASLFCFLETFPINTSSCREGDTYLMYGVVYVPELTIIVLQSVTVYIPIITPVLSYFLQQTPTQSVLGNQRKHFQV